MNAIHNEREHTDALSEMERLWDDQSEEGQRQLEVLAILIEDYEKKHHNLEDPDPVEALKNIMEWRGLTAKDLVPYIGSKSHVSEVLNGKRKLSTTMIANLKQLGIPVELLVGPPTRPVHATPAHASRETVVAPPNSLATRTAGAKKVLAKPATAKKTKTTKAGAGVQR